MRILNGVFNLLSVCEQFEASLALCGKTGSSPIFLIFTDEAVLFTRAPDV